MKKRLFGKKEGQTLLEKMLGDRDKNVGNAPEEKLFNPLQLALKDVIELRFEEIGTYEVCKMVSYTTQIDDAMRQSAKYFLQDPGKDKFHLQNLCTLHAQHL